MSGILPVPANWDFLSAEEREQWYRAARAAAQAQAVQERPGFSDRFSTGERSPEPHVFYGSKP